MLGVLRVAPCLTNSMPSMTSSYSVASRSREFRLDELVFSSTGRIASPLSTLLAYIVHYVGPPWSTLKLFIRPGVEARRATQTFVL